MSDEQKLILHNFLHPSLSIRKEGFFKFKKIFTDAYEQDSGWKELREFLWKAIEGEEDEKHQKDIVIFAIDTLAELSIRKLIRFVENGILLDRALKAFAKIFLKYIDDKILEAISKSLLRQNSKIHILITYLLSNQELYYLDELKLQNLFDSIFQKRINSDYKIAFTQALFPKNKNQKISLEFLSWFLLNYGKDSVVNYALLTKIKPNNFIWNRHNWNSFNYPQLNNFDLYLLDSASSPDKKVREQTINIMGKFLPNIKIDENSDVIYDFCNYISNKNLVFEFIKLGIYDKANISELFNCEDSDDSNCGKIDELFTFGVNPLIIVNLLLSNYPRQLLIDLTRDDPEVSNRRLAYRNLNTRSFWIRPESIIHGPYDSWVRIINQCITAMLFDNDNEIKKYTSLLLTSFLSWMEELDINDKNEIVRKLRASPRIISNIDQINHKFVNPLTLFNLKYLLTEGKDHAIIKNNLKTIDITIQEDIMNTLCDNLLDNKELLQEILTTSTTSMKNLLIEVIIDQFEELKTDSDTLDLITDITNTLIQENEVSVRSKAHFLKNKF